MNLKFLNESSESGFIEHGVYEFPTSDRLFALAKQLSKEREILLIRKRYEMRNAPKEKRELEEQKIAKEFSNAYDSEFHTRSDNKLASFLARHPSKGILESDLMKLPEVSAPPAGFRLFIVFSCRSIADVPTEESEEAGKRARRASILLREYAPNAEVRNRIEKAYYNFMRAPPGTRIVMDPSAEFMMDKYHENVNRRKAIQNYNAYVKSLEANGPVNSDLLIKAQSHLPPDERAGVERFYTMQRRNRNALESEQEKDRRQFFLDIFRTLRDDLQAVIASEID